MKLFADTPVRRTFQALSDVFVVVWVLVWIKIGLEVHDATDQLAAPGESLQSAGTGLAERMRDAGRSVTNLPLVGDDLRKPFEGAGGAADQLAAAGRAQVEAVHTLANWLGLSVALIPILLVLIVHLPLRIRFVRRATAGQRFMDSSSDLDLFALRALTTQPLHVLARISDDPSGAWRRGDADVVRRLAELELKDNGLRPPAVV